MPDFPNVIEGNITQGVLQDRETFTGIIVDGGQTVDLELDDGSQTGSGLTVTLTHSSGNLTKITDSSGDYAFDLGNLSSYSNGDSFTITCTTITETSELQERAHKAAKAMKVIEVDKRGDEYTLEYPRPVNVKNYVVLTDPDISGYARLDRITESRATINQHHYEIHNGNSFTTCKVFTVPAGTKVNVGIITPDTAKLAHFFFSVISDNVVTVNFYEADDYSGGTALSKFNRYRDNSNTSGLTITHTDTNQGGGIGTLIWTFSGGANKAVTFSDSVRFEFILARNKSYLLEAVGSNGNIVTMVLDWYETTNKN